MFELKTLAGDVIALDKTEATIELNNSLFNDGSKLTGSFSYPIAVAFTRTNKLLLGHAQAIETGVKSKDIQVYAKIGGKNFRKCTLKVAVSEKSFDCNLEIDLGSINSYIAATKLTELEFATFTLGKTRDEISASMTAAALNTNWKNIPYTFFPVRNYQFTGEAFARPAAEPYFSGDPDNPVGVPGPYAEKSTLMNSTSVVNGQVKFNVQMPGDDRGRYHTVPFFYLGYVLQTIADQLGFALKGDFMQHVDASKIVLYNVNGTFISRATDDRYTSSERQGLFFKADDHLPAITISEFFKILSAEFCVRITPDIAAGELNVSWKKSVFQEPVYQRWEKKLLRIKKQDFEISDGYTLSAEIDQLDSDAGQLVEEVVVGAGKEKIPIKAGALRMIEEVMPGSNDLWEIPTDNRPGNIVDPMFSELENYKALDNFADFPVRFMIYQGMVAYGSNPLPYPKGSVTGAEFSLKLSSLHDFAIKPWFDRTYACKTATGTFLLNPQDICNINDGDIILFKGNNGTTIQALFQKITFTTTKEFHVLAEVDLIVLDSAYIKKLDFGGIFLKMSESNPVTATYNSGTDPNQGQGSYLLRADSLDVDLTVSVFSDRNCTIPLNDSNIVVYVKVLQKEARNIWTRDLGPDGDQNGSFEDQLQEYATYRKILLAESNSAVIAKIRKASFHSYRIIGYKGGVPSSHEKIMFVDIKITRNQTFTLQADNNYIIID